MKIKNMVLLGSTILTLSIVFALGIGFDSYAVSEEYMTVNCRKGANAGLFSVTLPFKKLFSAPISPSFSLYLSSLLSLFPSSLSIYFHFRQGFLYGPDWP